ncbi:MAG: polysaccharide deacetylase family protein [Casimicrobiaceae bacterium]
MIWRSAFALASGQGDRARLSILIFHRVLERPDPLFPGEPHAAQFDALVRHVAARFRILPLAAAIDALRSGTLPARALAITFDDGYADNLAVAAPILQRYLVPATVFVATGYLDGGCMWNDLVIEALRATRADALDLQSIGLGRFPLGSSADRRHAIDQILAHIKYLPIGERQERATEILRSARVSAPSGLMLTRESLQALHRTGLDVGAHTVTHPILARLPAESARQEIVDSKRDLETLLGKPVNLFAYPNGRPDDDYSAEHVRMIRDAGFAGAVTTAAGAATRESDVYQLPRFTPWSRDPWRFDLMMLRNLRQRAERRAA